MVQCRGQVWVMKCVQCIFTADKGGFRQSYSKAVIFLLTGLNPPSSVTPLVEGFRFRLKLNFDLTANGYLVAVQICHNLFMYTLDSTSFSKFRKFLLVSTGL